MTARHLIRSATKRDRSPTESQPQKLQLLRYANRGAAIIVGRFCESRMLSGLPQTLYNFGRKVCENLYDLEKIVSMSWGELRGG
jgi:hypothetical protein